MDTKDRYSNIVPWSKVGISNDLMFMLVMSNRRHCKHLLEVLLGIKVKRFKRLISQKSITTDLKSKGVRLDICVETADCVYDIEMQTVSTSRNELGKRVRYYQSEIDRKYLKRGQHYRKLRQSIIIFICTFDPYGKNLCQYTFSNRCHEDSSVDMKDGALKIFFYTGGDMGKAAPEQKAFLEYVSGKKAKDKFTRELEQSVESYRGDGEQEAAYMSLEQMLMDAREDAKTEAMEHMKQMLMDVREDAKAEARAEGIKEGIKEKEKNIVLKMLKKNKTVTEIIDIIECSKDFVLEVAKANNIKVNPA